MPEFFSNSPEETISLGKQIALNLKEGSVVALNGTLGSGKTCLSKGIALGLGFNENLTSPTYTIINEYKKDGSPILYHIDAYRLNNEKDFEDIGGLETIYSSGISIIEWSERLTTILPKNTITVKIEIIGNSERLIKYDTPCN